MKKITRKQFITGSISLLSIFALAKVPSVIKSSLAFNKAPSGTGYGRYPYGGYQNNA